ncbi:hypothetical protein IAQ67_14520 [Paenibacillus peoriae]|uniref:Uncharacterized protein n=1 Tax=Paenibacillus peoriae TaxID=59893 RepID=A0A7H0Y222_9BACL|nr:hypothetical protein [Paenibacillus peoriae]QNR65130.1 hypothetical protein IAQ67_14520 [Paenibacillus peoriae]
MNYFTIKAIEKEKLFVRKAKHGLRFSTGKGKINFIESITNKYVYFRTEKSKEAIRVPREKIRQAIEYLLYRRMVTREKLGEIYKYNSFLMGLLRHLFVQMSELAWIKRSLGKSKILRLVLKGTRFIFAGMERSIADLTMVKAHGGRFVLFSYWNLRSDKHETWKYHIKRLGLKVLLDSGEYSRYRLYKRIEAVRTKMLEHKEGTNTRLKQADDLIKMEMKMQNPVRIEDYSKFILKHKSVLYDAFNLDRTGDYEESMFNLNYLYRRGIKAIPIWHPQSPIEALEALIKDDRSFDVIAIGGLLSLSHEDRYTVVNSIMKNYGEHQCFHLLGCSSPLIFKGDTFQCDSTGPLMGRRYKTIITENGHIKMDKHMDQNWTEEKCFAYNIKRLSSLEDFHSSEQLEFLIPPSFSAETLTLF